MFGAETVEPSPADLAGLLAGPGRLGRMGGTARVSVRVDAAWRVHVLVTELVTRGLAATWAPVEEVRDDVLPIGQDHIDGSEGPATPEPGVSQQSGEPSTAPDPDEPVPDGLTADGPAAEGPAPAEPSPDEPPAVEPIPAESAPEPPRQIFEVRTAYSRRLNGLARAWPAAAAELFLSGPRLRLWVAAAGSPRPGGYALGLDPDKDRPPVEAALVRAGLAGRVSDDGRHYLIVGRRRLARLAELVGERPPAAPAELWPGGATA